MHPFIDRTVKLAVSRIINVCFFTCYLLYYFILFCKRITYIHIYSLFSGKEEEERSRVEKKR